MNFLYLVLGTLAVAKKKVLIGQSSFFEKINSEWVFSVDKPTKVGIKCGTGHEFRELSGAGVLRGVKECTVSSDELMLLGGAKFTREMGGIWNDPLIPSVDGTELLSRNEEEALREEEERGTLASSIQDYARQVKGDLQLNAFLDRLSDMRKLEPRIPVQVHLSGLTIVMGIAVVAVIILAFKLRRATSATIGSPSAGR